MFWWGRDSFEKLRNKYLKSLYRLQKETCSQVKHWQWLHIHILPISAKIAWDTNIDLYKLSTKTPNYSLPQVSCRNRQQHNVLISALHPEGKTKVSCTQLYKFQSHCILQPLTSDQNEVLKYAEHSLCTGLIFPKIFWWFMSAIIIFFFNIALRNACLG